MLVTKENDKQPFRMTKAQLLVWKLREKTEAGKLEWKLLPCLAGAGLYVEFPVQNANKGYKHWRVVLFRDWSSESGRLAKYRIELTSPGISLGDVFCSRADWVTYSSVEALYRIALPTCKELVKILDDLTLALEALD